ncbi:insulin-degrading enzyme-like 2 [Drosophila guanche]|uniref:Peptidase M16 middle/third domain-containing protein n=1 Tax=Drosophila guanche TaxID=7266 RepID=A0A3B0JLM0_DROGU|nr:insulin-degrading enzyme-like 2 [Drosophila guanche]XP_034122003.1 insulin-degrading enzyme-like 2 [Drosophila guanche]XP_034122004.1 insulin-degrading enzyme-like 2 [Drosophila guanche]SPP76300.1 Hypothetical predicted protein [Drosophila guanche]
MPAKCMQLWIESKPMDELFLPEANVFVAHDFKLIRNEQGKPKLLRTDTSELWFRQDDNFNKPNGVVSPQWSEVVGRPKCVTINDHRLVKNRIVTLLRDRHIIRDDRELLSSRRDNKDNFDEIISGTISSVII